MDDPGAEVQGVFSESDTLIVECSAVTAFHDPVIGGAGLIAVIVVIDLGFETPRRAPAEFLNLLCARHGVRKMHRLPVGAYHQRPRRIGPGGGVLTEDAAILRFGRSAEQ